MCFIRFFLCCGSYVCTRTYTSVRTQRTVRGRLAWLGRLPYPALPRRFSEGKVVYSKSALRVVTYYVICYLPVRWCNLPQAGSPVPSIDSRFVEPHSSCHEGEGFVSRSRAHLGADEPWRFVSTPYLQTHTARGCVSVSVLRVAVVPGRRRRGICLCDDPDLPLLWHVWLVVLLPASFPTPTSRSAGRTKGQACLASLAKLRISHGTPLSIIESNVRRSRPLPMPASARRRSALVRRCEWGQQVAADRVESFPLELPSLSRMPSGRPLSLRVQARLPAPSPFPERPITALRSREDGVWTASRNINALRAEISGKRTVAKPHGTWHRRAQRVSVEGWTVLSSTRLLPYHLAAAILFPCKRTMG